MIGVVTPGGWNADLSCSSCGAEGHSTELRVGSAMFTTVVRLCTPGAIELADRISHHLTITTKEAQ
jgi:hypothetical protein